MEAVCSSETLSIYRRIWSYSPEDSNHRHLSGSPKSHIDLSRSRKIPVTDFCGYGREIWGSMTVRTYLTSLETSVSQEKPSYNIEMFWRQKDYRKKRGEHKFMVPGLSEWFLNIYIFLWFCTFMELGRPCSMNGEKRNAYRALVGKPEGKRPLGRQRRRWVDSIKMDIR
jgi:hypothetical protein